MKRFMLSALMTALFGVLPVDATVIYRNNFGNDTADSLAINHASIDWRLLQALSNPSGNVTDESGKADAFRGVTNHTGKATDLGNINAPASLSDSKGLVFLSNASSPKWTGLFYTEHFEVDRSLYTVDSFEWYANATNGPDSAQRVAIRLGSQWYVSDAFTPSTGNASNFATSATLLSLDFATANWYTFTAEVGAPFEIGAAAALPDGNISAFGIYVVPSLTNVSNLTSRFDTFTINATAIPEPTAAILIFGVGSVLLAARIRRTKIGI